ncbi:MAG: serine hydrolase [Microgenomates group bacterium]
MVWAPQRKKRLPFFFRMLFFVCIVFGIYILIASLFPKPPVLSPLADDTEKVHTSKTNSSMLTVFSKKKNTDELKQNIKDAIGLDWKNYSVLVMDTESDFKVDINEEEIFTAASVNKIPILAALYTEAQTGNIDLDTVITLQEADIQDYGTGSMRYDGAGSTYTIKTLAKLMMQQSDNTAAYILANHIVGMDTIQELLTSWGMIQTDMVNNKTSNADIALLMEKIYQGNIANVANTKEMLAFFKDGEFEDRIPGNLPKEVAVYHKIGTEIGIMHDVGIVVGPTAKYYIGILVSDVVNEEETTKLMASVSKLVYDYMK